MKPLSYRKHRRGRRAGSSVWKISKTRMAFVLNNVFSSLSHNLLYKRKKCRHFFISTPHEVMHRMKRKRHHLSPKRPLVPQEPYAQQHQFMLSTYCRASLNASMQLPKLQKKDMQRRSSSNPHLQISPQIINSTGGRLVCAKTGFSIVKRLSSSSSSSSSPVVTEIAGRFGEFPCSFGS